MTRLVSTLIINRAHHMEMLKINKGSLVLKDFKINLENREEVWRTCLMVKIRRAKEGGHLRIKKDLTSHSH